MFNPLRADDLILAVGRVLRLNAAVEGSLDDYQRSQALSAYSVSRNSAAEIAAAPALLAWLRETLLPALAHDGRPAASRAHERLAAAADGIDAGDLLGELLEELRREAPTDDRLRRRVQSALGELADRELAALADPPR